MHLLTHTKVISRYQLYFCKIFFIGIQRLTSTILINVLFYKFHSYILKMRTKSTKATLMSDRAAAFGTIFLKDFILHLSLHCSKNLDVSENC